MTSQQPSPEVRIVTSMPQPSAAVRVQQAMGELNLAALFDHHMPAIVGRLAELGAAPAGPPYGRYHEFGPDRVDVEIGFPVAAPLGLPPLAECAAGEIGASALPGGPVATVVHRGPYDTLSQTYDRLRDRIAERGDKAGAGPWESYLDNPAEVSDPSGLRTDVCWPLD
jgi:effector-binding domain-containing protein